MDKIHFRKSRKDTGIIIKNKKNKERHSFAINCHYLVTSKHVWSWLDMPLLKLAFFLRDRPFKIQSIALVTETERARRVKLDQNQDTAESGLNLPSSLHESL